MPDSSLISYIQERRSQKIPDKSILNSLLKAGWDGREVKEALKQGPPAPPPPKKVSTIPQKHSMWDTFEHALLFISMYVLVISIQLAINIFIDKWIPGFNPDSVYTDSYASEMQKSIMRVLIANILVTYPLFSFLFLRLKGKTLENPLLRHLASRKRLIYATLIITFVICIYSVIVFLVTFLNGNVSLNFMLHFVMTLLINGGIFAYYLREVKEDRSVNNEA